MADKPRSKHQAIFEHLHEAILGGRYKPGDRIPSEVQLSRRFGTTRVTVAKALKELEHAGFLSRRRGSGSFAAIPEKAQSWLVGLLVSGLGEGEIFEPICSGIASGAQAHQLSILWGQSAQAPAGDKVAQAERLCQDYIERKVSGVFFNPLELTADMEAANARITGLLDRAGIPIVLLDCDVVRYPRRSRYDVVGVDNRRIGYVLAEHLLSRGCRRIAFVARPNSAATVEDRIRGYREALADRGVVAAARWVMTGRVEETLFAKDLMSRVRPDGLICANDNTAAHIMRSLHALKIRVPRDIRVAGVDDQKYASLLSVPLTTVRQPCEALSAAALDCMVRRIRNPVAPARDVRVDFELVARESSGAPKRAGR